MELATEAAGRDHGMSGGQAKPHAEMLKLALEVIALLGESCTRIAVGGSLRRGKKDIGDIEIICQPDFQPLPTAKGGFIRIKQNAVNWMCDSLRDQQIFQPRLNMTGNIEAWADRHKRAWYKGVKVDLFIVLPDRSWGYTMLLRTGPGDANQALVTREGVYNREGNRGICPQPYEFRDGDLHVGEQRIETPEEKDVFAALGLPYIAPPLRSVEMYQRWAGRRVDPYPEEWLKLFESRARGWVGAPDYGNDVWLPGVVGRIENQPQLLELVKREGEAQGAA